MASELGCTPPDGERGTTSIALRMQPAESIVESSRLHELQLLQAMDGLVPLPKAYWVDNVGEYLPYPGLGIGFVDGATRPGGGAGGDVSGAGIIVPFTAAIATQLKCSEGGFVEIGK